VILSRITYSQWRDLTPESGIPGTKAEVEWRSTSQLRVIISWRTYNGRSDVNPECGQFENRRRSQEANYQAAKLGLDAIWLSEFNRLQLACTPIPRPTTKKPTGRRILRPLTPTEEDQPTKDALLPPQTSPQAKCSYGESNATIVAHLRWEAFPRLMLTYNSKGSTPSPGTKLRRKMIAQRKCTYGQDQYNSADLLRWLWWFLRSQLLLTIEVVLAHCMSLS